MRFETNHTAHPEAGWAIHIGITEAERQKLMEKLMDSAMHVYTVEEMLADMTPIYQRHISKSDIEAFIAFFGSSLGRHFLDQQPLIAKESMPLAMTRVQEKSRALTDEMKKDIDELNAKEAADAGAAKAVSAPRIGYGWNVSG